MTKRRTIPLLIILLAAAAALAFYCAAAGRTPDEVMNDGGETAAQALLNAEQMVESIRKTMEDGRCGEILLSDAGSTANCTGITVTEKQVEIASPGIYRLSGSLSNGQITVKCKGNVGLVLNGVSVTNADGPALYAEDAAHVQLWLADGTENRLASGSPVDITGRSDDSGEEETGGAAVYAKDTLSVAGTGVLTVEGFLHNAVSTTDHAVILDGELRLTAVNNGIRGKDSVTVRGGKISILSGNDGIHSVNSDQENNVTGAVSVTGGETIIRCYGDGIHAGKDLLVLDGTVNVTAGDTENITMNAGQPEGTQMPDGQQPPEVMQMPGGPRPPEGMQKPDGQQPPEGMQMPDGQQPPEGVQMPGGQQPPDAMMMPTGGNIAMEGNPNKTDDGVSRKGLKSGGTLEIRGGTVNVTSVDDCLHADDEVSVHGGELQLISADDGIHGTNRVTVTGGTVNIQQSYEGIEGHEITVSGGTVRVTADDDGFNANGGADMFSGFFRRESTAEEDVHPVLRISGGSVYVNAGGDGLDSNGDLLIQGGLVIADGPENDGNSALDSGSENGGIMAVEGGTVLAIGMSGMAESFGTESTQCSFIESFGTVFPAGTEIRIMNSDGKTLYEYTSVKSFNCVVFSSPDLHTGETVTLSVGEETAEVKLDSISNGKTGGFSVPGGFRNYPEDRR